MKIEFIGELSDAAIESLADLLLCDEPVICAICDELPCTCEVEPVRDSNHE